MSVDQATTLRELFARLDPRVLPVWVPQARDAPTLTWLTKLAQTFAQQGERTLVIDAARVHMAAALGLRARHDLQHLATGECTLTEVLLDAAGGLQVVPAVRAFDAARSSRAQAAWLMQTLTTLATTTACDRMLLLFTAAQAALLPAGGECLLPVTHTTLRAALHEMWRMSDPRNLGARADIAGFRLLFLGMDYEAATTLATRLGALPDVWAAHLRMGGCVRLAPDLVHVVRAAAGWRSAALITNATEQMA